MQTTRIFSSKHNRLLMLVVALAFIFTQTIDLQHTHEGDLSLHSDCQICFKLGSPSHVAIAEYVRLQAAAPVIDRPTYLQDALSAITPTNRSRAPPKAV